MKAKERGFLEAAKFFFYILSPIGLVYYFSDPQKVKAGLIKGNYISYKQEDHLENLLKAPEGYTKKYKNAKGEIVEMNSNVVSTLASLSDTNGSTPNVIKNDNNDEDDMDCSETLLSLTRSQEYSDSQATELEQNDKIDIITLPKKETNDNNQITIKKEDKLIKTKKTDEIERKQLISKILDDNTIKYKCNNCGKSFSYNDLLKKQINILPLRGDRHFQILSCNSCKNQENNTITIKMYSRQWFEIAEIALDNLYLNNPSSKCFKFREEICKFVQENWDRLCIGKNNKTAWATTLGTSMTHHAELFISKKLTSNHNLWFSRKFCKDLDPIPISCHLPKKRKAKSLSKERLKKKAKLNNNNNENIENNTENNNQITKNIIPEQILYPYPSQFPLPPRYYSPGPKTPLEMKIISENSAPQILIKDNGLTCSNVSGYRMARASYPIIDCGSYYFEVKLSEDFKGGIRVGWSTEKGDLQGPTGYDKFSFSYRNKTGQKFHRARGKVYGEAYNSGDTIGCLIVTTDIIEKKEVILDMPKIKKKKNEKWVKSTVILPKKGEDDQFQDVMIGSKIIFFKNGISQGIAFTDIPKGSYYPAISLFMGAICHLNFGPEFTHFPTKSLNDDYDIDNTKPICSVVPEEHIKEEIIENPLIPLTTETTNQSNDLHIHTTDISTTPVHVPITNPNLPLKSELNDNNQDNISTQVSNNNIINSNKEEKSNNREVASTVPVNSDTKQEIHNAIPISSIINDSTKKIATETNYYSLSNQKPLLNSFSNILSNEHKTIVPSINNLINQPSNTTTNNNNILDSNQNK